MEGEIRYGTIPRRLAAAAIDLAILGAVVAVVTVQQPDLERPGTWLGLFVLGSALAMFYRMVLEGSGLQGTPGKYLVGLRAVQVDGGVMRYVGSALRSWPWWLSGAVGALAPSLLPAVGALCLLALAPILWDERRRGLHDRMAGTVVITRDSAAPPAADG